MRLAWALLLGLAAGIAFAWWQMREPPRVAREKEQRAQQAAAAIAEDKRPVLYRWHDRDGTVHVTQAPPKGRRYQRIPLDTPTVDIDIHGDRR